MGKSPPASTRDTDVVLEWVAMPSSRASSQPRDWTQVSHIARCSLSVWEGYLLFLFFWEFYGYWLLSNVFSSLLMWSCDFPPKLFNIVNYFHWFLYTEPVLHYWNKLPNLVYDSLYILLGSIFLYFVKDFSSIVMRDICLSFFFFLDCLCLVLVSE